jgi:hypothetical protein
MAAKLVESLDHHRPVAIYRKPPPHLAQPPVLDGECAPQFTAHQAQQRTHLLDRLARLVDGVVARADARLAQPGCRPAQLFARHPPQPFPHRFPALQTIRHPPVLLSA